MLPIFYIHLRLRASRIATSVPKIPQNSPQSGHVFPAQGAGLVVREFPKGLVLEFVLERGLSLLSIW